eukprot:755218-Amorphochlora_amoeboformis.AAC.2
MSVMFQKRDDSNTNNPFCSHSFAYHLPGESVTVHPGPCALHKAMHGRRLHGNLDRQEGPYNRRDGCGSDYVVLVRRIPRRYRKG